MTPFDPIACLAMLLTFYPIVGPSALVRARSERPDYFASGAIIGSCPDKLQLPDGRIFDCIFNCLGADTRWQMLDVSGDGGGGGGDDEFALEPGPIVPIDLSAYPPPLPIDVFVPLTLAAFESVEDLHHAIDDGVNHVSEHVDPTEVYDTHAAITGDIEAQLPDVVAATDILHPVNVYEATDGAKNVANTWNGYFDRPSPPDPPIVDPGNQPDPNQPPDQPHPPEF